MADLNADSSATALAGDGIATVKATSVKGQNEFVSALNQKIAELESSSAANNQMEREASKLRRKQMREVQKALDNKLTPIEEKLAFLQSKYIQQTTDFLKMEKESFHHLKELDLLTKERDKVQVELRKSNTLKDRLEELCRQLQRENKEVLEESKRRNEEEMKQRQALQLKFTQAITDVTSKMDEQQKERMKQLEENESLRTKLGEVLQQFDAFNQLLNSKDLEVKLANAKLEQQLHISGQVVQKAELLEKANENLSKANEIMKSELEHHFAIKEQNALLISNNRELKMQIESYSSKFGEFQSTLTKSNEMFGTLKKEIDTANKQRAQALRDREELRKRSEKSEASMVQVLDDNRKVKLQKEKLEGLCRALQAQLKQPGSQDTKAEEDSETSKKASEITENVAITQD